MTSIYDVLRSKSKKSRWNVHPPTISMIYEHASKLKLNFPTEYIEFLLNASFIRFGEIESVQLTAPENENYLPSVYNQLIKRKEQLEINEKLLPLSMNSEDFFCLTQKFDVKFLGQNGFASYSWESIEDWIEKIWLTSDFTVKIGS